MSNHYRYSTPTGADALRTLGEHPTEFGYLLASLDRESRRKIWKFATYCLRVKNEAEEKKTLEDHEQGLKFSENSWVATNRPSDVAPTGAGH